MTDFSFMKSGLLSGDRNFSQEQQLEFIRMCGSIMRVLSDEACRSAFMRAQACGRKNVVERDMILALKYEAHEFFKKNIEARFIQYLEEERSGNSWIAQFLPTDSDSEEEPANIEHERDDQEENDDEEEDDEDEDDEEDDDDEEEDEASACHVLQESASPEQRMIFEKMEAFDRTWSDWNPEDPVQQLVKCSIDKIGMQRH